MDLGGAILAFIKLTLKKIHDFWSVSKGNAHTRLKTSWKSCFCSKFLLFAKLEGFSNVAYISLHVLT